MKDLYPEVLPYRAEHFAVEDTHALYVEEVGTSDGIPALFLHGGPAAGVLPSLPGWRG